VRLRSFAKIKLLLDGYRESWHAIKKLCNLPFLTLKVGYPERGNTFIIEHGMSNTIGNMYTLKPRTQGRPIEVGCLARHKEVQCVKV